MKIGISGLPSSGKTSLFKALVGSNVQVSFDKPNIGSVKIPDKELHELSETFNPKKTTQAEITFVDIPGIPVGPENKKRRNEIFSAIRKSDALVEVINAFSESNSIEGSISSFDADLLIMDLDVVEKRLERLKKEKKDLKKERELAILNRCKETLEQEKPLSDIKFSKEDLSTIRSFEFFTLKPILYVINISDSGIDEINNIKNKIKNIVPKSSDVIVVPIELELELSELSTEEKAEFLSSYGLSGPMLPAFIDASYLLLGYETFYTVGKDEVKSWTITKGLNARKAAGKIHSDIERGFIAAEVISFADFKNIGFSFKDAKTKGVLRIEGENYIVKNKDIIQFRFNV